MVKIYCSLKVFELRLIDHKYYPFYLIAQYGIIMHYVVLQWIWFSTEKRSSVHMYEGYFVMQVHGAPHCSAIIVCFFMYRWDVYF